MWLTDPCHVQNVVDAKAAESFKDRLPSGLCAARFGSLSLMSLIVRIASLVCFWWLSIPVRKRWNQCFPVLRS